MGSPTARYLIASASGILSHWTYFIHGEHDLAAARIATCHLSAFIFVVATEWQLYDVSLRSTAERGLNLGIAYLAGLFTSIIFFRLFLSPLRHINGPLRLKITKLTHVWDMAFNQNCKLLEELRKQYGDVVRTGPNEVTIFGAEAFHKVHGPESTCSRAAYYDLLHPMVSLDTTRDSAIHSHRRRIWDQAFSIKDEALDTAVPLVYEHAEKLNAELAKRTNDPLDISVWLEYYTFDLMGLFGLTVDFGNLTKGEHPILALYHMAHRKLGPLAAAPWIKHLLMGIPYIERMKYYRQFMDWAHAELERNIEMNKEARKNVIGYVVDDAMSNGGLRANWNFVLGDFILVIVAGSDPVRQVLANMLYYLTVHPEHLATIRTELATIDLHNYKALQQCSHLNASIYETLRLNPAVPSSGLRLPPKGGLVIQGTFIPEGTTIVTPQYSILRDARNFLSPEAFIPERFTSKPDLIINKLAFVPWSTGKMACLGKNLSLMEIRVAAALLLTSFDFDFAPGEDGTRMFTKATDYFTTTPGPLNLVLKNRIP
ncbi:CypX Cytochrome P450 [Pyrenophora tritici-repentis]|nr:CypX Cytochrome P450 [Pyrenophora tritici-repentis]